MTRDENREKTIFSLASTPLELSQAQRAMWFFSQIRPQSAAYNILWSFRILGAADEQALRYSIERLAARHQSLRATFPAVIGEPTIEIRVGAPIKLEVIHLLCQTEDSVRNTIEDWARARFNLEGGPLVRFGLFHVGASESIFVVAAHHIIADLRSLTILLDDIEVNYLAEVSPEQSMWSVPTRDYSDFVRMESQYTACAAYRSALARWRERLTPLPNAVSRSEVAGDFFSHAFELPQPVQDRIRQLASEARSTPFAVVLSIWALAQRATGQSDVVVGVPVSTRDEEYSNTVGCFTNTVPVRIQFDHPSVSALVYAVGTAILEAVDDRAVSLQAIVDVAKPVRSEAINPLFQSIVNSQGFGADSRWAPLYLGDSSVKTTWAGLEIGSYFLPQQEGQAEVGLDVSIGPKTLRFVLKSSGSREAVRGLANKFIVLAGRVSDNWNARITAILSDSPTSCDDTHTLNPANMPARSTDNIVSRFDNVAKNNPTKTAIVAGADTSYRDLWRRSVYLSHELLRAGARPGDRVAVTLDPSSATVAAMLGIMRIGASYVPIDRSLPEVRIKTIVARSGIRHAIVGGEGDSPLPASVHQINATAQYDLTAHEDADQYLPGPESTAYSLFTSGSTGDPKGIDVVHSSVCSLLDEAQRAITIGPDDVVAWFHSASFDLSVWEIWGALTRGATLAIVPKEVRTRPDATLDFLVNHQVTMLQMTPSGLGNLLHELQRRGTDGCPCTTILSCGEALSGTIARQILGRGSRLFNLYGPAEATVYATLMEVSLELCAYNIVPIGRPFDHCRVYLLDDEGRPVPPGSAGEVYIGGHGVAVGYVALPELNRERFLADPSMLGGRMYRTGDYASWDGEKLLYLGRRDNQVKIRGYRVELSEIELALRALPGVREAVALFAPDLSGGMVNAVLEPRENASVPTVHDLREFLQAKLPSYMLPSRYFVARDLPLNSHAKLDRPALQRMILSGALVSIGGSDGARVDSQEFEAELRRIWAEVLCHHDFGVDDQFFDIGGNSLSVMRVQAHLAQLDWARHVVPTDLFKYPTIRDLSDFLASGSSRQLDIGANRGDLRRKARDRASRKPLWRDQH